MTGQDAQPGRDRGRAAAWVLAAGLLLVVSVVVSATFARVWTDAVRSEQQRSAAAEASGVASAASTSLQRMSDLTRALGAGWVSNPDMTLAELGVWVGTVGVRERYPETLALTVITPVPRAELPGFVARLRRDGGPAPTAAAVAGLPVRDAYCLARLGLPFVDRSTLPDPGLDLCAEPASVGFLHVTRDSGEPLVMPMADPATGASRFFALVPLYRPGAPVPTTVERRAAFLGWAANLYDADAALSAARGGHDGTGLRLHRTDVPSSTPGGDVVTSVGPVDRAGARVQRVPLTAEGGWELSVVTAQPPGLSAQAQGRAVLAACLALALLTLALVAALGGSRERALHLVRATTRELQHQATHDALTDLPNRALLLQLLGHRLAAAGRGDPVPAVLFLDLDGFKQVNDTLGHAAGDALLREVADRLRSSVRAEDVVGRFAGDEFLVVVRDAAGAPAVADRVLQALRSPVQLPGEGAPRRVTASIGIASGTGPAQEVLHDADVALYAAKAAGRDRWARHAPAGDPAVRLPRQRRAEELGGADLR